MLLSRVPVVGRKFVEYIVDKIKLEHGINGNVSSAVATGGVKEKE